MTVEDIMFALTIAITIGMIVWSWVIANFMSKTSKALKDIADNQFDAKQVMALYEKKNTIPIVYESRADIKELRFDIRLPYDKLIMMGSEDEVIEQVKNDIAKEYAANLMPFIDFMVEADPIKFEKVFKSRLRVVKPN